MGSWLSSGPARRHVRGQADRGSPVGDLHAAPSSYTRRHRQPASLEQKERPRHPAFCRSCDLRRAVRSIPLPAGSRSLSDGGAAGPRGTADSWPRVTWCERNVTTLLEARGVTRIFGGGLFDRRSTLASRISRSPLTATGPPSSPWSGERQRQDHAGRRSWADGAHARTGLYKGQNLQTMSRADWRAFRHDVTNLPDPMACTTFLPGRPRPDDPVTKFGLATSRAGARRLIDEALRAVGLRPEKPWAASHH